jgi:hypothetical protein
MKEIDSKEHFLQEFETLFEKINQNIIDLAQFQQVEMDKPSIAVIEKLNRLKLHRTKLNNFLLHHYHASEAEWIGVREEAKILFKAAQDEYLLPFEEMANH